MEPMQYSDRTVKWRDWKANCSITWEKMGRNYRKRDYQDKGTGAQWEWARMWSVRERQE